MSGRHRLPPGYQPDAKRASLHQQIRTARRLDLPGEVDNLLEQLYDLDMDRSFNEQVRNLTA